MFAKRNGGVQPKPAAGGDHRPVTLDVGDPRGGVSRKPAAPERGWGPAGGVVDLMDLSPRPPPTPTPPPTRAGKRPEVLALALFCTQPHSRTPHPLHGRRRNHDHLNAV